MVLVSPNCAAYTDSAHILVRTEATAPSRTPGAPACTTELPVTYSCQTTNLETPDAETVQQLAARARTALAHCDVSRLQMHHRTTHIGARSVDYSGDELVGLGMASNCFRAGNDPNDATHFMRAECTNQYDFVDSTGRVARDTSRVFTGQLSACDVSEEAMPQLTEDVRKVVAANAAVGDFRVQHPSHLACKFAVLPHF